MLPNDVALIILIVCRFFGPLGFLTGLGHDISGLLIVCRSSGPPGFPVGLGHDNSGFETWWNFVQG